MFSCSRKNKRIEQVEQLSCFYEVSRRENTCSINKYSFEQLEQSANKSIKNTLSRVFLLELAQLVHYYIEQLKVEQLKDSSYVGVL